MNAVVCWISSNEMHVKSNVEKVKIKMNGGD